MKTQGVTWALLCLLMSAGGGCAIPAATPLTAERTVIAPAYAFTQDPEALAAVELWPTINPGGGALVPGDSRAIAFTSEPRP